MDLSLGDTRLIIDACKTHRVLRNQAAYVLATTFHETAHTMKPITEMGGPKYLKSKPYYPYIGRGYVQLTWEANYSKASDAIGVDFVNDPSLLLQARHAAPILVVGMAEGWFTGKKLGNYITLDKSDFANARRIINGTDKASLIAGYARHYDALLLADEYGVASTARCSAPETGIPASPSVVVVTDTAPTATRSPADAFTSRSVARSGFRAALLVIVLKLFGRK
jgi:hypothetical protein